jgi:hypothetical protein
MSRIVLSADVSADPLTPKPSLCIRARAFSCHKFAGHFGCGIRSPSPASTLRCPSAPTSVGDFFRSLSAQTPHQQHQGRSPNEDAE